MSETAETPTETAKKPRKSASPMQPGSKMFTALQALAFGVLDDNSAAGGATVAQVAAELDCSPELARRFLDDGQERGIISCMTRPGEGANLYRRPSTLELARTAWLNEAKGALRGMFGDSFHLSLGKSNAEPTVTLPLRLIPGLETLADAYPEKRLESAESDS